MLPLRQVVQRDGHQQDDHHGSHPDEHAAQSDTRGRLGSADRNDITARRNSKRQERVFLNMLS